MNEVVIKKSVSGAYECKAVSETGRAIKLLVPVSTYSRILEHVVPNKSDVAIRWLFEAKYDQHEPDLGTLDSREVDGLFSDIRAKKRYETGGWAKPE